MSSRIPRRCQHYLWMPSGRFFLISATANLRGEERMQTPENHLVCQLQTAHRLCAGFYNMFFHSLFGAIEKVGFDFNSWEPLETDWPVGENPRDNWEWDNLPVYASEYTFFNCAYDEPAQKGNAGIIVQFYMDERFASPKVKPEPLEGEPGQAILQITLYRVVRNTKSTFGTLWEQSDYPKEEGSWGPVTGVSSMKACFRRFLLEDFIRHPGIITEWVQNVMGEAC